MEGDQDDLCDDDRDRRDRDPSWPAGGGRTFRIRAHGRAFSIRIGEPPTHPCVFTASTIERMGLGSGVAIPTIDVLRIAASYALVMGHGPIVTVTPFVDTNAGAGSTSKPCSTKPREISVGAGGIWNDVDPEWPFASRPSTWIT